MKSYGGASSGASKIEPPSAPLPPHAPHNVVDLVPPAPPFKSNQDYNVLFEEKDGSQSAAQILAFEDTWHWDMESRSTFDAMTSAEQLNRGGVYTQVAKTLLGLRSFL